MIVQQSASGLVTRDEAGSGEGISEQENKASCTTHCSSNSIDAGLNVGGTAPVTCAPRGASRVYPDSVRTARIGVGAACGCGTGACERVMCVLSEHGQVRTLSRQPAAWPPCCLSSHKNQCCTQARVVTSSDDRYSALFVTSSDDRYSALWARRAQSDKRSNTTVARAWGA
jgi:hypothetical protein